MPVTSSDEIARPTWALTCATPGTARNSRLRALAVSSIEARDAPGLPDQLSTRSRSSKSGSSELGRNCVSETAPATAITPSSPRATAGFAVSGATIRARPASTGEPFEGDDGCSAGRASIRHSAGVTVKATTIEASTANRYELTSGSKNAPAKPPMAYSGNTTSTAISVA